MKIRNAILHALVVLLFALPALATAIPNISGFITQVDSDSITAAEWNTFVGGVYTYINGTLLPELNKLASKGQLLSHNGTSITAIGTAGAPDDGKVLTADNSQATGLKWAAVSSVATLTTKGDLLGYGVANARVPVGANGKVLTARSTDPLGVAWEDSTGVPVGVIVMWSGTIATIPTGWALCDGQSGRPNLQGLFIMGAGNVSPAAPSGFGLQNPGATGGAITHTHGKGTLAVPSAQIAQEGATDDGTSTKNVANDTHGHSITGSTATTASDPAWYALAFIIKT